jgi:hypothetical protein
MKTKVLITVKTYPTLSSKYEESVCTAGITDHGKWVRIYPVTFRELPYANQYKKYDWIEIELKKNKSDFRPESYTPVKLDAEIKVIGHLGTASNWIERKSLILKNVKHNIKELIRESKDRTKLTSLAVFRPTEIINFHVTSIDSEWNKKKLAVLSQQNIFRSKIDSIKKLPFKFVYEFKDSNGVISNLMIEDWEIGELFWKMLNKYNGDKELALQDVKKKFWGDLSLTKDLYFFLGTSRLHHFKPKPFMIIGLFYPKKEESNLFDR